MIAKKCLHIALAPLPFLIISFTLLFYNMLFLILFISALACQLFFIFFFRDVKREIKDGIISPADGKIMEANNKISIFMSIFDMHVNLMPCDGKIVKMNYFKGKHAPAFKDVSKNERLEIEIESRIGKIKLIQIAGIFARRIVPYIKEGDKLKKGEKIGIIRFGSRVELYLPADCKVIVRKNQKVKAGETIAIV